MERVSEFEAIKGIPGAWGAWMDAGNKDFFVAFNSESLFYFLLKESIEENTEFIELLDELDEIEGQLEEKLEDLFDLQELCKENKLIVHNLARFPTCLN